MATLDELASWISSLSDDSADRNAAHVIIGRATTRSVNGLVEVDLDSESIGGETITLPTSMPVDEGDSVAVTLVGGRSGKTPYVSNAFGGAAPREKVLYNDQTGTLNNITLTSDITQYDRVRIEYKDNSGVYGEQVITPATASKVTLFTLDVSSTMLIQARQVTVSGASVTTDAAGTWSSSGATTTTNHIYITRIVGLFN